jgi:putative membrane protein
MSAVVSALHVLSIALGIASIFARGRALKGPLADTGLRRLFAADTVWGVAGALLLATGLLRAFAGLEKGTAWYMASHLFWTKLTLFGLIIALEIWPMVTFIGWRVAVKAGVRPDTSKARTFFVISHIQMALAVVIVFVAAFMARGFGMRGAP